ncbi:hypothetical protein GQ53DRAFT_822416 [Thozetella sp. PMI_491]|nr:hypothetical protein GQ53DRAFT_822416 [Thozetella sp. PMI_491]
MTRLIITVIAFATAAYAGSWSEYYHSDCGPPVNVYGTGSAPVYCNTQQGASIGWTEDQACTIHMYAGNQCAGSPVKSSGPSKAQCVDFPATGGSWKFTCP